MGKFWNAMVTHSNKLYEGWSYIFPFTHPLCMRSLGFLSLKLNQTHAMGSHVQQLNTTYDGFCWFYMSKV
jgi:hypothetical protein